MKKLIRLSLIFVLVLGILLIGGQGKQAEAQTSGMVPVSCTVLSYNLRIGQYNSGVTALQNYLIGKGYLHNSATGYFGGLTYAGVVLYQTDHGVTPSGFVGPVTRGVIQAESCGGSPTPVPVPTPSGVTLSGISPQGGATGTSVVLTGSGFNSSANSVYFDSMYIGDFAADMIVCGSYGGPTCYNNGGQIRFTIPSSVGPYCPSYSYVCPMGPSRLITPGSYQIYVKNVNGISNAVTFVVTGGGSYNTLSIGSIDAPNTLAMNAPGTWTVHVVAGQSSNLHYSVVWGDEAYYGSGIMAPTSYPIYSNATFTHAYSRPGTYNPQFTVSDDFGHSVSATASVQVTPWY